jgi:hypothetical protein
MQSENPLRGILGFPGLNLQYSERRCATVKVEACTPVEVETPDPRLPPLSDVMKEEEEQVYGEDPLYNEFGEYDCCYEARPVAPAAPPDPVDPVPAPAAAIPLLFLQNGRWHTRLPRSWSITKCLVAVVL